MLGTGSSSSWHSSNKRLSFLCSRTLSKPQCLLPLFRLCCLLAPPPVLPAYAAQQPEQQRRRVDPRLLEEAAARQQALAEGKLTPQKTVINPDANWLQGLPPIMQDMGVSGSNQNPRTSPLSLPQPGKRQQECQCMPPETRVSGICMTCLLLLGPWTFMSSPLTPQLWCRTSRGLPK